MAVTHTGNADFDARVDVITPFIDQLFVHLVEGPLMTDSQRKVAASSIAAAVVDSHQPEVHIAYNCIREQRMKEGTWLLP